jgi:hypothetical protein
MGSVHLSDPIYSGLSRDGTVAAKISTSSVDFSSEVNSSISLKPTESEGEPFDLLDNISYKLDFEEVSDLPRKNSGSEDNNNFTSNFDSDEDFTDLYVGVSYGFEDEWMLGLELRDDDPTIFSSEPDNKSTARQWRTL